MRTLPELEVAERMTDPFYEIHRWDDGYVAERLKPWAATVNLALLSGILWCFIWAAAATVLRLVQEIVR